MDETSADVVADPEGTGLSQDLRELLRLLDLEENGPDIFLGHHPEKVWSRTFGGQLVAQAIIAAGRTVGPERPIHAINAHFVRGGAPKAPIEYHVDRHRDGRSIANRTVTAYQDGQELFVMLAAFQDWGKGLEHGAPLPDVPGPEDLPRVEESFVGMEDKLQMFINAPHPIEMRYTNDPAWILKGKGESLDYNRVWMRTDGALPDDPLIHVAALAYSSDTTVLDSIVTTHGLSWGWDRIIAATVNHSIWFHRPFRFDDWALYATESPVAAGSRGLARGHFYSRTGELLATTVQEGVIRHFPARR
ncbi:acyl-CoA thioesterase [Nocardia seriolae]|uniref:acyl-CoA thioesterase n=1 Tax=Nocardia seriolae TaxID=37332 RepID=UPI0008F5477F|nr:acyl-CoA thioesterase II [Nocardia seriolae]OJF84596.1 acyl-CoA thioesterase II [Nocardia seriolae]PSK26861.1 acyl-CoA thioesterase II [Nocardia seriolae]QOW37014.1 acyl-CoA thioesterase II [Nocardia seriolae]QUN21121.1 acyl-CoA thioesterase II [Nocardia seriolae]WNJ62934.1 acyl-CoA thioesterase II [Nocardia seriolae]